MAAADGSMAVNGSRGENTGRGKDPGASRIRLENIRSSEQNDKRARPEYWFK